MSIRVMSRVWDHSQAEGNRLLVLLALADFADDEGYCWPKVEPLAHKARIGVRTVQSALADLEALGELERSGRGGRGQSCTFRVVCGQKGADAAPFDERRRGEAAERKGAASAPFAATKGAIPAPFAPTKGAESCSERVPAGAQKGAECSTPIENHQEPSEEPSKSTATPAVAGGAPVGAAASPAAAAPIRELQPEDTGTPQDAALDPDAPVTGQRATFAALCRAAGWSSRDLTTGNREQLGQLAARILDEPEGQRPTPAELTEVYRDALGVLSDRLGRKAGDLTVLQFRQAIGRWVEAQEREARERQERAELERREAAADVERTQQAEQARAAFSAEPVHAARLAWQQITTGLRPQLPPATWATWLEPAQAKTLEGRVLTILVPSDRHVDWITGRLAEQLAPLSVGAGLETLRFVAADAAGVERAA